MDIGIIGAGDIGSVLTRRLRALGHHVSVANSRGPRTLAALAAETGAVPVTIEVAARAEDVVIVAISEKGVLRLPTDLFATMADRPIVVDTGNYYPSRDGRIVDIDAGLPDSQWVARQLGRPVIKAFNNITFSILATRGLPAGSRGRICLPVAGDNPPGKAVILRIVDQLGFDGLDAGSLAESWRQQPGTAAYCRNLDTAALRTALAEADPSRIEACRIEAEQRARRIIAARRSGTA